jgi:hypothetical protein
LSIVALRVFVVKGFLARSGADGEKADMYGLACAGDKRTQGGKYLKKNSFRSKKHLLGRPPRGGFLNGGDVHLNILVGTDDPAL